MTSVPPTGPSGPQPGESKPSGPQPEEPSASPAAETTPPRAPEVEPGTPERDAQDAGEASNLAGPASDETQPSPPTAPAAPQGGQQQPSYPLRGAQPPAGPPAFPWAAPSGPYPPGPPAGQQQPYPPRGAQPPQYWQGGQPPVPQGNQPPPYPPQGGQPPAGPPASPWAAPSGQYPAVPPPPSHQPPPYPPQGNQPPPYGPPPGGQPPAGPGAPASPWAASSGQYPAVPPPGGQPPGGQPSAPQWASGQYPTVAPSGYPPQSQAQQQQLELRRTSHIPPGQPVGPLTPAPVSPPSVPVAAIDGFSWRRFFLLGGIILLLAAGATVMWWVTGRQLDPQAVIIGVAAAIVPVPLLVTCFLWLGRYNPKPAKYLVFCFGWGACVATSVALGVNTLGGLLYAQVDFPWQDPQGQTWADFFTASTVAPVIEESMKALGPLLIFWFRRRYFTGIVDALVYCGLSAVGFAMVENILYLGRGFAEGSSGMGVAGGALVATMTFIVRILFSGFAHPLFTSMTGIGLGLSRRRKRGARRWIIPVAMILVAMMLHASWNLMASLGSDVLLSGYLSVMMPIFFTALGGALWMRASEARLAVHVLSDYVDAGWFSPPEIAALATYRRRNSARRWARRVAGDAGAKAMREYQHLATRLALLRDGLNRGSIVNSGSSQNEHDLLAAINTSRQVFTGHDTSMPRSVWDGRYYQVQFPDGSVRQVNPPAHPVMPIPIAIPPIERPPAAPVHY